MWLKLTQNPYDLYRECKIMGRRVHCVHWVHRPATLMSSSTAYTANELSVKSRSAISTTRSHEHLC